VESPRHGNVIRTGVPGVFPAFVGLWLTGEVCYVISVLVKFGWVSWMMFNYLANLFSIAIIVFYLMKGRKMSVQGKS
jgi:hypothetical protein